MNREDITKMARESGFTWEPINNIILPLERFFHAAYTTGATDERQFIINFLESMHERCLGQHNYYLHAAKLISDLPSAKPTKSS